MHVLAPVSSSRLSALAFPARKKIEPARPTRSVRAVLLQRILLALSDPSNWIRPSHDGKAVSAGLGRYVDVLMRDASVLFNPVCRGDS
jgi:hypothetical protein